MICCRAEGHTDDPLGVVAEEGRGIVKPREHS